MAGMERTKVKAVMLAPMAKPCERQDDDLVRILSSTRESETYHLGYSQGHDEDRDDQVLLADDPYTI